MPPTDNVFYSNGRNNISKIVNSDVEEDEDLILIPMDSNVEDEDLILFPMDSDVDEELPSSIVVEGDGDNLSSTTSNSQATTPIMETSWNDASLFTSTPTSTMDANTIEMDRENCMRRLLFVRKRLFEELSDNED